MSTELSVDASRAYQQACQYASDIVRPDGHWCGELKSNCTITAEYILLLQALQHPRLLKDKTALCRYLYAEQNEDGSWSIAPGLDGDVSTSTEAYLGLKILGESCDASEAMRKAQKWIVEVGGGVEKVRVFTRIYLATFGLLPWTAVPELPAELILMPALAPINIYKLSSWARSTMVPLLVVCHHRPIFTLPNGKSSTNAFLDEIWRDSNRKHVPYHDDLLEVLSGRDWVTSAFTVIDKCLKLLGGLRLNNPLRRFAIAQCMEWITSHQESSGDWAGIFPPMHVGVLAYILEGYSIDDGRVRRALEAIEEFAWQDEQGKRIQACVSPVWDTVLMAVALADVPASSVPVSIGAQTTNLRKRGLQWVRAKQILDNRGDWRVYRTLLAPGGFSFEYHNTWYPDVDDTAAAVIAFLKDDMAAAGSKHVLDAVTWILGMQSRDGGWAAFDVENDKLFLNKIPFSDMDSLCDPSTSDIVGRVLEALGLFATSAMKSNLQYNSWMQRLLSRVRIACDLGVRFLVKKQCGNGAWYGRWGVNFIYGTSNVLSGLAYHYFPGDVTTEWDCEGSPCSKTASPIPSMVRRAIGFLLSIQREDGGWGESLETYRYPEITDENQAEVLKMFLTPSTPSQTAWALMGLAPYLPTSHMSVRAGIRYLVSVQTVSSLQSALKPAPGGIQSAQPSEIDLPLSPPNPDATEAGRHALTWSADSYTGTGFPNRFYLGYKLYSHYFPMMALAGYLRAREQERMGEKFNIDIDTA